MSKSLLKIISAGVVLCIVAGSATVLKGGVSYISEALFMTLYLGVLITALVFIRRNKVIRQFIYHKESKGTSPK